MKKQYRFTLYISAGGTKEVPGDWRDYDLGEILKTSEAYAENGVAYTVEFREVE